MRRTPPPSRFVLASHILESWGPIARRWGRSRIGIPGFVMVALRVWSIGLLSLAWLLLAVQPAWPADEQRIAAVVNDDVVSVRDLNDRLEMVLLTSSIR